MLGCEKRVEKLLSGISALNCRYSIAVNSEKSPPSLCPETLLQCKIDNVVMRSETAHAGTAGEPTASTNGEGGKSGRNHEPARSGAHAGDGGVLLHLGAMGQPVAVGDLTDEQATAAEMTVFHGNPT